jgi:hypothetical protein
VSYVSSAALVGRVAAIKGGFDEDLAVAEDVDLVWRSVAAGPIRAMARWAVEPLEIAGRKIAAGDRVLLVQHAANHDPAGFADPERLDIGRRPNRHTAFGLGIHICLGAPLARLEAEEAFRALAREFAHFTIHERELRYVPTVVSRSLTQLHITFHQVVPPNGIEQEVEATLEGVDVTKGENLKLDSEGGAQVTTPKTRYLTTGIAVMLAASSAAPDEDRGRSANSGDMGGGAANGASGFKLVGTLVGAFAHSRVVASGFGFYGAGMSVYSHFLARGRDVVYPKDMSMVLDLGTRKEKQPNPDGLPPSKNCNARSIR